MRVKAWAPARGWWESDGFKGSCRGWARVAWTGYFFFQLVTSSSEPARPSGPME